MAPTLHSPACQEQLTAAVREVARAVENLISVCNETCDNEELLNQLKLAAAEVTRSLNDLLNHIKLGKRNSVLGSFSLDFQFKFYFSSISRKSPCNNTGNQC